MQDLIKYVTAYLVASLAWQALNSKWRTIRNEIITDTLLMAEDIFDLPDPLQNHQDDDIWDRQEIVDALQADGLGHYSSTLDRIIFLPQNRYYSEDEMPELIRLVEVISSPEGINGSVVSYLIGMCNLYRYMRELPYNQEITLLVCPEMHKYFQWETQHNPTKGLDWQVSNISMEILPALQDYNSFPFVTGASTEEALDAFDRHIITEEIEDFKFLLAEVGLDWQIFLPGGGA